VERNFTSRRLLNVALAVVLAMIAAAVYRASVFSQFEPIRQEIVNTKLESARNVVTIALPDLSIVRGHTAVVGVDLQNTLLEPRRVAVGRDDVPATPVVLPAYKTVHWDIVLPPDVVRALNVPNRSRTLELRGDADGWAVTSVELRNYHLRVGARPSIAVVPRGAGSYTPARLALPVAVGLLVVAVAIAFEPKPQRKILRLIGNGVTFAAVVLCLACLLLPAVSRYHALLSPSVFLLLAGGLFAPRLAHAAARGIASVPALVRSSPAIAVLRRRFTKVADFWTRHEVTFNRGAALLGLSALAIAQPIFDVLSNSPEFFAARGTTAATAIASVLAICFGIPLLLVGLERAIRAVSRRLADVVYTIMLALLSAAVVMPWLEQNRSFVPPWDVIATTAIAAVVALAGRSGIVRQFLTALAPAALVVASLFLLDGDIRQSFLASESPAGLQAIERKPPIVFVIFDEMPLNSLMDKEGSIDPVRYPNFAALARDAYWFRNASTVASNTSHAVPAILSGRYPTAVNDIPTLRFYPVNLFTTLARHYEIAASLRFQQLCPPRACQDSSGMTADTLDLLLSDLSIVWLHIVLPERFTDWLPPVTDDWAEFGRTAEARSGDIQNGRAGVFAQFLSMIQKGPPRLYFIHSMLPHMPLEYVPSGRRYRRPDNETQLFRHDRLFVGATAEYADAIHQRHLAQAGFVDHLVGDLIARLHEVGLYDEALIVLTADHGASYREGRLRRQPQEHRNLSDIFRVPLFVKLPGQRQGETVDRIVETVDILPTVLDVIGAKGSIRFDGRSLFDSKSPPRSSRTFVWRNRSNVAVRHFGDLSPERADSLQRKERRFGHGDEAGLYALPETRHLLGLEVSRMPVRRAEMVRVTIRNSRQFQDVNLERDPLPLYVNGVLSATSPEPLTVAVAVNGTVAAVTRAYAHRGSQIFGTLIPEKSLRQGDNEVTAFVVEAPSRSN
jgi:hypothetical protein